MNLKPLIIKKIEEYTETFPDYSFGEILYSCLTSANIKDINKTDLLKITDNDFYTMLELSMNLEKEEV